MRALVTGATGFVGTALLRRLATSDSSVRACFRSSPPPDVPAEWLKGPDLSATADWAPVLEGVDVVVHLAARVHVMSRRGQPDGEYRLVNVEGTKRLAEQAVAAGVRRFVFLSSVKVHGERGLFSEASPLAPADDYGVSKRDAEAVLRDIEQRARMEVVIIRPPLVYGPGVKANFQALASAVRKRVPLPLGAIANRRSLVGVDNLVDLIALCMTHPAAATQTFLVSDGDDLSTPELVRRLAAAMNLQPRLLRVPEWVLALAGVVSRQSHAVRRLTDSLQVDISKARQLLGWTPPLSVDEGLRRASKAEPV